MIGGARERPLCAFDKHSCQARTVKVVLRHESADSEEDRGLGPVPNGTLNPRGLPPSLHFRDIMPL